MKPIHQLLSFFKIVLLGLVMYLSWKADPSMDEVSWIPSYLGGWADEFVRARTAVPFLLLGFLNGASQFLRNDGLVAYGKSALAYFSFAVLVELIQLLIPTRHCDPIDMVWAVVGVLFGQSPWVMYLRQRDAF